MLYRTLCQALQSIILYFMDIEEQLQHIIERIKTIRVRQGVSQMELSLRASLSQSFIANLEKGKKQPSVLTLIRIADALNISPQEFFPESLSYDKKEQIKEKIHNLLDLL